MEKIVLKNEFNIKDLSKITKKQTNTIRSWEQKGIIDKPKYKDSKGWRTYSKNEFIDCLEKIINYSWQRNVIKNKEDIELIILFLKGEINYANIIHINI